MSPSSLLRSSRFLALVLGAALLVPVATVGATPTATLQGTAVLDGGGAVQGSVTVVDRFGRAVASGPVDAGGRWSVAVPVGDDYRVRTSYEGRENFVRTSFAGGAYVLEDSPVVAAPRAAALDLVVPRGAEVTGTLTGVDGRLGSGHATVVPRPGTVDDFRTPTSSFDPATQAYRVWQLAPGSYDLVLSSDDALAQHRRWSDARRSAVAVARAASVRIDEALPRTSTITGTVSLPVGVPAPSGSTTTVTVRAADAPGATDGTEALPVVERTATVEADGTFAVADLAPGRWALCVVAPEAEAFLRGDCRLDARPRAFDAVVDVARGQVVPTALHLSAAGAVSGTLTVRDAEGTPASARGSRLDLYGPGSEDGTSTTVWVADDGTFAAGHLEPGDYVVRTSKTEGTANAHGWWPDAPSVDFAGTVTVTAGETTGMGVGTLAESLATERIAGPSRFATAVEVSRTIFPAAAPDVPVVYVAVGTGYADALSAGPAAAAEGGALLMVRRDDVPTVVADELRRLRPDRVVLVGGPAALSPTVADRIEDLTGVVPERRAGANRYATSLAVVQADTAELGRPSEVFLATGRSFPDALAAGPAAAHRDGLVLLVDGRRPLSAEQLAVVRGVEQVVVAGGPAAVSDAVLDSTTQALPGQSVRRLGGGNRYGTAAALNDYAFESPSDRTYLATGAGFADALAGGVLAAVDDAPLYLTSSSCVPEVSLQALLRQAPNIVTVLGGAAVVSERVVESLPAC